MVSSIPWCCEKKHTKNDHFREGGKVGRSNATPIKLFSVDSYDLNTKSFKFDNDIFINVEMPRSFYIMYFWKIRILLPFRPFASEVLYSRR